MSLVEVLVEAALCIDTAASCWSWRAICAMRVCSHSREVRLVDPFLKASGHRLDLIRRIVRVAPPDLPNDETDLDRPAPSLSALQRWALASAQDSS